MFSIPIAATATVFLHAIMGEFVDTSISETQLTAAFDRDTLAWLRWRIVLNSVFHPVQFLWISATIATVLDPTKSYGERLFTAVVGR